MTLSYLRSGPFRRRLAPILLLATFLLPSVALTADTPVASIPGIDGTTLTGLHVRLPQDLHARAGVLILGFSRDSRTQARDWGKRLADDFLTSSEVEYFEMPVIAAVPRFLRSYVLRSIATQISDRDKPHFLPISENEAQWRSLVHYQDPKAVYILVIDATGHPIWQTSGDVTDATYATLRQHLPAPAK